MARNTQAGTDVEPVDVEPIDVPGTDLATKVEGTLTTLTEVDRQNVAAFLAQTREVESQDTDAATVEILARILRAESVDDVLAPQAPVPLQQLIGFPIVVDGVRWMRSDFDEGPGMYALVDAVHRDTGEKFLGTCGGMNVLAQLFAMDRLGAFPVHVVVTRARKATANGYFPLWLEPPPA